MNWSYIKLTSFRFRPAIGVLGVDVRITRWYNGTDKDPSTYFANGSNKSDWTKSPYGTFWIGGFRTDNVTTKINTDITYNLEGVNNISTNVSSINSSSNWTTVNKAIWNALIKQNGLSLPFWVDINTVNNNSNYDEIMYTANSVIDISKGIVQLNIGLRRSSYVAKSDGTVVLENTRWNILADGFRPVKPIPVDTSKMYESFNTAVSKISNGYIYLGQSYRNNFITALTEVENSFTQYIYDTDVKQNLAAGARTLDQWKQSLKYEYRIGDPNSTTTYTSATLQDGIINAMKAKDGWMGYLRSTYNSLATANGVQIWVTVTDTKADSYNASIQGSPANTQVAKGLSSMLDTTRIVMWTPLLKWRDAMNAIKGTTVTGGDELAGIAGTITPPTFNGDDYGKGMSWQDVESFLTSMGYQFNYTWLNAQLEEQTSTSLPSNFEYNPADPKIKVKITYTKNSENMMPPVFIFGSAVDGYEDPTKQKMEITLSLAVKTTLNVDLSAFTSMKDTFAGANKNVRITGDIDRNDATVQEIIRDWIAFENQAWDTVIKSTGIANAKDLLQFRYSVNGYGDGRGLSWDVNGLWYAITTTWSQAISNSNKTKQWLPTFRFYSPSFAKGMKIQVTVQFKNQATADEYNLKFADNKSSVIVNHGIGTTIDFAKFTKAWEENKAIAGEGSTYDAVHGFTPYSFNGIPFDDFETIAENDLGIKFRWSSDQSKWVTLRNLITSVNPYDPSVWMSMSATNPDKETWSNELNIANAANGVTDSNSTDDSQLWSDGVKLQLNISRYINVEDDWMNSFIADIKSAWGGNTKNTTIDDAAMQTAISSLISKIITGNNLTDLSAKDFAVEFKTNASSSQNGDGSTFTPYSSSLASAIANGNYWNSYNNGVYVRVILKGADDQAANHDDVKITYESNDKNYALKVSSYQVFENTSNATSFDPNVNPIKFYTGSVADLLSKITVNGKTTTSITLTYPTEMYYDALDNKVYTDKSKKLKVQFSTAKELTEDNAGYNDSGAQWTDTPPTSLSVDKWLYVRAVPNYDNYVYGPQVDWTAKAIKLDTSQIKPTIPANISSLATSVLINGIINVISNNNFDALALKQMEQNAINTAVDSETGRQSVEIVYNLRTSRSDTNNEWLTLDQLLEKLNVKDYGNDTFGIISFVSGQYELKASIRSTRDDMNVIDSTTDDYALVQSGVSVATDDIKTRIDLSEWVKFLKNNKALVVERTKTRALVELNGRVIQPKQMPGTVGTSFLSGRTFSEIVTLLSTSFGVSFQFSTDQNTWYDSIDKITSFDDTENKVYMKISGSGYERINIIIDNQELADANSTYDLIIPIQYPKTLTIDEQWIIDFIASTPVSGNTKFIAIDEAAEQALIQKIVDANPPVAGDPAPTVWVEYKLGNGQWMNRQTFIDTLKQNTIDATTNKVEMRLAVDPIDADEPIYAITQETHVLSAEDLTSAAQIKIFVNETYEQAASKVSVVGSNDEFEYNYGSLPVSATDGTWSGANGLLIQWTKDKSATYADAATDSKWSNNPITEIDPADRYLAIRIISKDAYVYGPAYTDNGYNPNPVADIHVVDTTQIKSKISVDLSRLQNALVVSGYSNELDLATLKQSEKDLLDSINLGDKLAIKYKVTLANGTVLSGGDENGWMSADQMQKALEAYSTDYSNSTSGLIKFSANGIKGATISATYVSTDDQYVPVNSDNVNNITTGVVLNTNNVKTKIDLSAWIEVLKTEPTSFAVGSTSASISGITPPGMKGSTSDGEFTGRSYQQIISILKSLGVTPEFQAPGSTTGDNWVSLDNINSLNSSNQLFIRFSVRDEWKDSVEIVVDNAGTIQNNSNPTKVPLNILLPITIKTNLSYLEKLHFEGTTINITNIDSLKSTEQEILNQVKEDNKTGVPETDDKLAKANIQIVYSINNISINGKTWMSLDEMQKALQSSRQNLGTNKVLAKYVIVDNPLLPDGSPEFQLSTDKFATINKEEFTDSASFKVYIHSIDATTPTWMFDNLKVQGDQTSYSITNYDSWIKSLPKGITAEFNSVAQDLNDPNSEPSPDGWSKTPTANPIDANKHYWVRFVVQDGFIFENASQTDPKHSDPIKLDASQITVTLKLESAWLDSIVLTGNTKNLGIDESAVIQQIVDAGQMPVEGIVQIKYTVDGTNWYTKDDFINKLVELDGAIDETNWIIRRESIKARYEINQDVNATLDSPIQLSVDGKIIPADDPNAAPQVQLITDTNNTEVKGYINVNKLTPFIASNFVVNGSSSNLTLHTSNTATFNKMMNPYSTDGIFKMLYKVDEQADFLQDNKVWVPGKGISEYTKLNGEMKGKYFAVALQSADENYIVYHDDVEQANGYILSTPDIKVHVSTEITNPLIGKTIAIRFMDENNQPLFYQNDGAFIVNIDSNGTKQSFNDFLNSTDLTADEKQALELTYYVADHQLSDSEYQEATSAAKIGDYAASNEKYGVWKSYPSDEPISNLDLGLTVNDYVIVALRVKQQYISSDTNDNGYVLKDDNHTPSEQSRAFGFKVHADQVNVDWNSMRLVNVGKAESASYGLDGYAVLQNLSLKPDAGKNYLGVSVKLNYFDEFYRDAQGNILVSASGNRLVKRDTTAPGVTFTGNYYTDDKGQPLVDADGNKVGIYQDANHLPPAPITESSVTRSKELLENSTNNFKLELDSSDNVIEYSFFKNQTIQVEFVNKKGLQPEDNDLYDYYVDSQVTRDYTINKEIKFPISNDKNIQYKFNSEEFVNFINDAQNINDGLVFVNPNDSSAKPLNGQASLKAMYVVTRTANNEEPSQLTTLDQIKDQIQKDFNGQVVLKVTYTPVDGQPQIISSGDISSITTLRNGDKFKIEIVSVNEDDLIYAQQPSPLIFTINGLYEPNMDQSVLQYLRVEQVGSYNGKGSFRIYVDGPNMEGTTIDNLPGGYKFQVRVWGKDKTVKHAWTSDLTSINDLENGDKVEWKLVAKNGSPVDEAYYNTVANPAKMDANNGIYAYMQVNLKGSAGANITDPVDGIGKNPSNVNEYPENSGYLIANLKDDQDTGFTISFNEFKRVMDSMNFSYVGVDGKGDMISGKDIADVTVNAMTQEDQASSRATHTLKELIDLGRITFYYENTSSTKMNQFNWNQVKDSSGNWLTTPGCLTNGDKIRVVYSDAANTYEWYAPDVYGLKNTHDSMPLFAWIGIAAASVVTLGIFAGIYFLARNRKLKSNK